MTIYCMQAPKLVKAILSHTIWTLSVYFSDYEIDAEKGRIFGTSNPNYAFQDFKFNEYSDFEKLKKDFDFSISEIKTVALDWDPIID